MNLLIGNKKSNVAICTLWSEKEKLLKKFGISKKYFFICGNLYTEYGITQLLKTVLANPQIRYIVVCGKDVNKVGEKFLKFMKGEELKVEVPKKFIEEIRKNVKVFDFRNREYGIKECLKKLKVLEPFRKPIVLKEKEVVELKNKKVGFVVEGNGIPEVWLRVLNLVMKFGELKESEYGIKQKEILDVLALIKGKEDWVNWLKINKKELNDYIKSFFGDKEGVAYTYGERLFSYFLSHVPKKFEKESELILNQIDLIVKKLRNKPFTRRAIAITWRDEDFFSPYPPCLTQIVWSLKKNKLVQTAVFRSHDIWGAWLWNAYALRKLQEFVAEKLKVELGTLAILSISAHVYEPNFKECEKLLKKHKKQLFPKFVEDELGFFLIEVKKDKIIVKHFTKYGKPSGFCFEGKEAEGIYKKIIAEGLVSKLEHAAYLGKELARAELAIKKKFRYVQV